MIVRDRHLTEDQLPGFLEEICGLGSDGFSLHNTQCSTTNNKISYHINKLSPARRQEMEEHANHCQECFEDLYFKKKEYIGLAVYLRRIKPNEQRNHQDL